MAERLDEEAELLVKWLDVEDVDLSVDADDEGEVCRVTEMFDEKSCLLVKSLDDDEDNAGSVAEILEEEVGRLLKLLGRENVDWRDEEDEVYRAVGVVDEFEVPGLLVIARDKDSLVEADDEDEVCRVVGMVDKVLG